MEWNKAKTILIIAFLCLNGLLGYQLWIDQRDPIGSNFGNNTVREETELLLKNREIRLESIIPAETPTLSEITVQFNEAYSVEDVTMLEYPIDYNILMNNERLEELLVNLIPFAEEYKLDPYLGNDHQVVLNQKFGDLPLFEIELTLTIENQAITAYTQRLVEVESGTDGQAQRVLNAHQAVGLLAEFVLPRGSVILDVSLGYYGENYNAETQVLAPQWRIVTGSGEIYYVNGINGEVTPSQKEKQNEHTI